MNLECPIQSVDWQAGPPPCSPPFPCEVQSWTEVLGKICILEAFLSYTCPTPPLSHGKRLTRVSRIFPKFHRCIMCGGRGGQFGGFKMQGFLQKKKSLLHELIEDYEYDITVPRTFFDALLGQNCNHKLTSRHMIKK